MDRAARSLWGLAAVGGATAVGLTTRNPGFIVITLIGGLLLPHILGIAPPHRRPGWDRGHMGPAGRTAGFGGGGPGWRHPMEERLDAWHRQAHQTEPASAPTAEA